MFDFDSGWIIVKLALGTLVGGIFSAMVKMIILESRRNTKYQVHALVKKDGSDGRE